MAANARYKRKHDILFVCPINAYVGDEAASIPKRTFCPATVAYDNFTEGIMKETAVKLEPLTKDGKNLINQPDRKPFQIRPKLKEDYKRIKFTHSTENVSF